MSSKERPIEGSATVPGIPYLDVQEGGLSQDATGRPLVTRTTHTLPFERLSGADFERLSLALLEEDGCQVVQHMGASGQDQGLDILVEHDGRAILVQCKNYRSFGPSQAEQVVRDLLAAAPVPPPIVSELLLIVGCRVSPKARRAAEEAVKPLPCRFWAQTELDAKVNRHPRILARFFQIVVSGFEKVRSPFVGIVLAYLYIAIAVATVTDRDLLIGSVALPLIGIVFSVKALFILAPFLVLFLHPYLLADRFSPDKAGYEPLEEWLYKLMGFVLGELLPLGLLVWIRLRFLPFHSKTYTAWHQLLLFLDLLVIGYFQLSVRLKLDRLRNVQPSWNWERALGGMGRTAITLFLLLEANDDQGRALSIRGIRLVREQPPAELEALFYQGLLPEEKLLARYAGLDLSRRDLRNANFSDCVLINADFRGSDLTGAHFSRADLRGARFGPLLDDRRLDDPPGPQKRGWVANDWPNPPGVTRLGKAELGNANLRKARLVRADLEEANLTGADLRDADLAGANLRRTDLRKAHLQGAELASADLTGADLREAKLLGASFSGALLPGADLRKAEAQAVDFSRAHLYAATLDEARLDTSDFKGALTVGASFRRAYLRGASHLALDAVDLNGSHVDGLDLCENPAAPWRTDLRGLQFEERRSWSSEGLQLPDLQQAVLRELSAGIIREEALNRIAKKSTGETCLVKDPSRLLHSGCLYSRNRRGPMVDWPEIQSLAPGDEPWGAAAFRRRYVSYLVDQACKSEGLARGLVYRIGVLGSLDKKLSKMLQNNFRPALTGETSCLQRDALQRTLEERDRRKWRE